MVGVFRHGADDELELSSGANALNKRGVGAAIISEESVMFIRKFRSMEKHGRGQMAVI